MESAAIAQTCMMARVPFISIRVLSDTPGSADNIGQYEDFWNSAPAHTFELTRMMLSQLPEAF